MTKKRNLAFCLFVFWPYYSSQIKCVLKCSSSLNMFVFLGSHYSYFCFKIFNFSFVLVAFVHLPHSLPKVLLSSALCRWGYWSAIFLRAACAHTIKAFIGRFTWGLFFSPLSPWEDTATSDHSTLQDVRHRVADADWSSSVLLRRFGIIILCRRKSRSCFSQSEIRNQIHFGTRRFYCQDSVLCLSVTLLSF